jgi:hypothetical protein
MLDVPISTFAECLERLGLRDLVDDLDPDAERQICRLAELEDGVVLGFPLAARPFYTCPLTDTIAAGFDLLFNGMEITTGWQRLHRRDDLERAPKPRGISATPFDGSDSPAASHGSAARQGIIVRRPSCTFTLLMTVIVPFIAVCSADMLCFGTGPSRKEVSNGYDERRFRNGENGFR